MRTAPSSAAVCTARSVTILSMAARMETPVGLVLPPSQAVLAAAPSVLLYPQVRIVREQLPIEQSQHAAAGAKLAPQARGLAFHPVTTG